MDTINEATLSNTIHHWGPHSASDVIDDRGGADILDIDAASTKVRLTRGSAGDDNDGLYLTLGSKILFINGYFDTSETGGHIETIQFTDGVILDLEGVLNFLETGDEPPPPLTPSRSQVDRKAILILGGLAVRTTSSMTSVERMHSTSTQPRPRSGCPEE